MFENARTAEKLAAALDGAEELLTRVEEEGRDFTDEERAEYDGLLKRAEYQRKVAELQEGLKSGRVRLERAVPGPDPVSRRDPWAAGQGDYLARIDSGTGLAQRARDAVECVGLPDRGAELLTTVLDREDGDPRASGLVLAALDPQYRAAFEAVLRNPRSGHLAWDARQQEAFARVEHLRAALSLTDANGGFLVPFALDPQVTLTSSAAANPLRAIATKVTTLTEDWNGVIGTGVTAEWLAEAAEAADGAGTFDRVTITPEKLATWLVGSYEVIGDSNVAQQLPALIQDAFDSAESNGFVTGAGHGSTQPWGLVTRVAAVTASRVSPTTGGTFSAATELYRIDNALPTRARGGKPVWLANRAILNTIRQFGSTLGASFWADLGAGVPPSLLGSPVYEASAMSSAVTTGSSVVVLGDVSKYFVCDRLGTTLVYDPVVKAAAHNRPSGQAGWFAYRRVSGDVVDANQFRIMTL